VERQGFLGIDAVSSKTLEAMGTLGLPIVTVSDGHMADAIKTEAVNVGQDAAATGKEVLRDVFVETNGIVRVEGGHDTPVGEFDGVCVLFKSTNDAVGLGACQ
jgi:hypothetical protein